MPSTVDASALKAKLETLLQTSIAGEPNSNGSQLSAVCLVNGDRSYTIDGAKLEFIQDAALKQMLTSRRRFGPRHKYSISCSSALFEQFVAWIKEPRPPLDYQPFRYSSQIWIDHAVEAWFLAHRLGAREFEQYALSQFIQNCSLLLFGPWQMIQDEAPEDSSLSLFSNHWIAWNLFISRGQSEEYRNLTAAKLTCEVHAGTKDPRIYDIEHWFKSCGANFNPSCDHDAAAKVQRQLQQAAKWKSKEIDWDEWTRRSDMAAQELQHNRYS